jgi:hypothetical protein
MNTSIWTTIGIIVLVTVGYLLNYKDNWIPPTQNIPTNQLYIQTGSLASNLVEKDNAKILQDVNFRIIPIDGDIIRPLLKGEFVTILSEKDINWKKWYNVSQKWVSWWISYLAFISDPTKASASNCDSINWHVDEKWYCSCNDWYSWSWWLEACGLISQKDLNIVSSHDYYSPTVDTYVPTYYPSYSYGECTSDCSWHDAWNEWASDNGITNTDDCDWKSDSFIEWCEEYVIDEYDGCMEWYDCEDIDSYENCDDSDYCSSNLQ